MPEQDSIDWEKVILKTIKKESKKDDAAALNVKQLRKHVLEILSLDESDKKAKKGFKKAMTILEEKEALTIDADGTVTRNKRRKNPTPETKPKEEARKLKKQKREDNNDNDNEDETHDTDELEKDVDESGQATTNSNNTEDDNKLSQKGIACKGNPGGVTRLFLGNLPFSVDETSLSEFLPHEVTHIKWITDKETGKFYGSAFIEMDTPTAAAKAVAMAGSQLLGRSIKINFAPSRPGDIWPPANKVVSGGTPGAGASTTTGGQAGGKGVKAMGPKPENCVKLFIGNLSYDIDDEIVTKFFDNVGAEVKAVRWLSHKETGDFKGCGFVEFWNTEACEKAATLNGKNLLGRPIRIDWTD